MGGRAKGRPIGDLRSAKEAARHAGNHRIISFLNRGLLSRFAADSRSSRTRKQPPQKRKSLNNFIRSRKRYGKVERDAADLFAHKKRGARSPPKNEKKTSDTRILVLSRRGQAKSVLLRPGAGQPVWEKRRSHPIPVVVPLSLQIPETALVIRSPRMIIHNVRVVDIGLVSLWGGV